MAGNCPNELNSYMLHIPHEALVSLFISSFVLLASILFQKNLSGIAFWMRDLTSLDLVRNGAWLEICQSWRFTWWKKFFLVLITAMFLLVGIMNPLIWIAISPQFCLVREQSKDLSVSGCAGRFDFQLIPYGSDSACATLSGCKVLQMAWERFEHKNTLEGALRKSRGEGEEYSTAQVELPSNTTSMFWLGSSSSDISATWSTEIQDAQQTLNPIFLVNAAEDNEPDSHYCDCCIGKSPITYGLIPYRIVPPHWENWWYGLGYLHNYALKLTRRNQGMAQDLKALGFNQRMAQDLKALGFLDVEGNSRASLLWRYSSPVDLVLGFGKTSMRKILISDDSTLFSNNGTLFETSGSRSEFASRLLTFYAYIRGPLRRDCNYLLQYVDRPKMKLVVTTDWLDDATGETWSAACSPDSVFDRPNFGVCFIIRSLGVKQNFSVGSFPSFTSDPANKGKASDTYALLYDPADSELKISDLAGYKKLFEDWDQEEAFTDRLLQTFADTCLNLHAKYEARVTVVTKKKDLLLPISLVIIFAILSVALITSWSASCHIKRWSDYEGSLSLFIVTHCHVFGTTKSGLNESLIKNITRTCEDADPQGKNAGPPGVELGIRGNNDPHNMSPLNCKTPLRIDVSPLIS